LSAGTDVLVVTDGSSAREAPFRPAQAHNKTTPSASITNAIMSKPILACRGRLDRVITIIVADSVCRIPSSNDARGSPLGEAGGQGRRSGMRSPCRSSS
jgi:hypothetical protein